MIQPRITDLHNPSYGYKKSKPKKKRSKHRSRSNPGPFALTLGLIGANPTKGERTVAKKKKNKKKATRAPAKANRKRSKSKGRKNPGVSMATIKRIMGRKKKKGKSRRNPVGMFGHMGAKNVLGISAGILGGVTVAKLVPPMLPASWTATDMGRFFTTAGVAAAEAFAAHFLLQAPYRDAVWAGAGAQTLSTALNPILRKVSSNITLGRIQQARAMGQLRDFVPGNFPEPHNPIYQQMMLAAAMNPGATAGGGSVGRYRGRFR